MLAKCLLQGFCSPYFVPLIPARNLSRLAPVVHHPNPTDRRLKLVTNEMFSGDKAILRIISWDYDGTLAKTKEAIRFALTKTLVEFERPLPFADHAKEYEKTNLAELSVQGNPQIMFGKLFGEKSWYSAYQRFLNIYRDTSLSRIALKDGSMDALQALKGLKKHYNLGVVIISHKEEALLQKELRHLFGGRVPDLFDYIHAEGAHARNKPDHEPMLLAMHALGYKRDEEVRFMHIGDGPTDELFAENCGKLMNCEAVYVRKNRRVFPAPENSHISVYSIGELAGVFKDILSREYSHVRAR